MEKAATFIGGAIGYGLIILISWCFTRSAIVSALKKFFDKKPENKEK